MKKLFANPTMNIVSFETEEAVTISLTEVSVADDVTSSTEEIDASTFISENFFII